MRNIEFRGMHVHAFSCNKQLDGTWVCGYLVDENYINDKRDLGGGEYLGEMLVDSKTVGQFTGLLDKNGTKIFEGDILSMGDGNVPSIIFWDDTDCQYKIRNVRRNEEHHLDKFVRRFIGEVIGNIHENHELLEDSK